MPWCSKSCICCQIELNLDPWSLPLPTFECKRTGLCTTLIALLNLCKQPLLKLKSVPGKNWRNSDQKFLPEALPMRVWRRHLQSHRHVQLVDAIQIEGRRDRESSTLFQCTEQPPWHPYNTIWLWFKLFSLQGELNFHSKLTSNGHKNRESIIDTSQHKPICACLVPQLAMIQKPGKLYSFHGKFKFLQHAKDQQINFYISRTGKECNSCLKIEY